MEAKMAAADVRPGVRARVNVALSEEATPQREWLLVLAVLPYPGGVTLVMAKDERSECQVFHVEPATELTVR